MERWSLGVWLGDRPGALGAVAGAIGAAGADIVDIEVLERERGRVLDVLVMDLPSREAAGALSVALSKLDGVAIDHFLPLENVGPHVLVDPLEVAAALVAAADEGQLLDVLARGLVAALVADRAEALREGAGVVAVATSSSESPAEHGPAPGRVVGGGGGAEGGPEELVAGLGRSGIAVRVTREGWPFTPRDRRAFDTLADIAGARLAELREGRRGSSPPR